MRNASFFLAHKAYFFCPFIQTLVMFLGLAHVAAGSVYGTVNVPLHLEVSSGYRKDKIHWHLMSDPSIQEYAEIYKDLEYFQNGLGLALTHRDLSFGVDASYSAFGRGNLSQTYTALFFAEDAPEFQFQTEGWSLQASSYFGYSVDLTAGRTYHVIVTPSVGYFAFFDRLSRRSPTSQQVISDNAVGASSYTLTSSGADPLHVTWYGFFLRFAGMVDPGGPWGLGFGYHYHLPCFRFKATNTREVQVGATEQSTTSWIHQKSGDNLGHTGWIQANYRCMRDLEFGLGARFSYFSTPSIRVQNKETTDAILPSVSQTTNVLEEQLKLRWNSLSLWFQMVKNF